MRNLIKIIILIIIAFLYYKYIYESSYHCDHAECQLGRDMPLLSIVQEKVELKLISSTNNDFHELEKNSELKDLTINNKGKISFLLNEKYKVIATPQLSSKEVTWTCSIEPDMGRELKLINDCGKLFRDNNKPR